MQLLHESTVLPEEIDSLGHMNVRYYMARMEAANRALMNKLNLDQDLLARSFLRRTDTYTRFRREQFEGANLHTVGGMLSLGEGGMRSYVEIQNPATQDVAATFIVNTALIDRSTRQLLPLPAQLESQVAEHRIEIPEYAVPRSLNLDAINTDVTLELLNATLKDVEGNGMMTGKRSTTIEPGDVDADGWLKADQELMFLPFAKMAAAEQEQQGPPVINLKDGRRVGWAVMETRNLQYTQPRLGDELDYFSSDISIQTKSRLSRRWAFNRNTGELLGINDTVGVCIDLDARRAIDWPDELRTTIEKHLQPQLA